MPVSGVQNDTIKILKIALIKDISDEYMPSVSPLQTKYKFGDSILLTSRALPLKFFPTSIGKNQFKLMSENEICQTILKDTTLEEVPNYLNLTRFEKNDSGYYIQMQSLSCRPYGGGGSLGLYFKKIKDSFVVTGRSSSSIN
jgi:hypothetical protein